MKRKYNKRVEFVIEALARTLTEKSAGLEQPASEIVDLWEKGDFKNFSPTPGLLDREEERCIIDNIAKLSDPPAVGLIWRIEQAAAVVADRIRDPETSLGGALRAIAEMQDERKRGKS